MARLGLLLALVAVAACDTPAPSDVSALAGVYTGTRTADALGADPEVAPATVTVATDAATRSITFTLDVQGDRPVVVPGTVDGAGTISASNALGASALGLEFVVDPSGTLRGTYAVAAADSARTLATGVAEGRLAPDLFLLTLVEPEAGGVRVEYRAVR